jgi:UDP-N-acetyl-D-galactosamine dehydrogenase
MDRLIGVIGLGYIGLPLLVNIKKHYEVIGFDINIQRLNELRNGYDRTNELDKKEIKELANINLTNNFAEVKNCDILIITVPTPVTEDKIPDLRPIKSVVTLIGKHIKNNTLIILESTVYPGITEEYIGEKLAKKSKKKLNVNFFIGYSPERANPGDKKHTLTNTVKVISASSNEALYRMKNVYEKFCLGGLHIAENIKVAESAKIIENIQRDLNIALINELAVFFNSENINFRDVLAAANTKWNFLKFEPGFVGGHCIGVDPYYLLYLS